MFKSKILFSAKKTVAASELPPPNLLQLVSFYQLKFLKGEYNDLNFLEHLKIS